MSTEAQLAQFLLAKLRYPLKSGICVEDDVFDLYEKMNENGVMDELEEEYARMHASLLERRNSLRIANEKYGKIKQAIYNTGMFSSLGRDSMK